jgi:predicted DNA-binding transcriptional regulator YafY
MQIQNLFEIVYILLEKKKSTATELAKHFGISVRTVYRCVERLCEAGIPLYMTRGKGGGISIMDEYVLDQAMLSDREKQGILSAVQGLAALQPGQSDEALDGALAKLAGMFSRKKHDVFQGSWIEVDFSSWENGDESRHIFNTLKQAILDRTPVSFEYFGASGEKTGRIVEPWRLVFKEQAWYLYAFCRLRSEERFFKLRRMRGVRDVPGHCTTYPPAPGSETPASLAAPYPSVPVVTVTARVSAPSVFRAYDEFREHELYMQEDGSCIVKFPVPDEAWTTGFLLSFGSDFEVLDPPGMRTRIAEALAKAAALYEDR